MRNKCLIAFVRRDNSAKNQIHHDTNIDHKLFSLYFHSVIFAFDVRAQFFVFVKLSAAGICVQKIYMLSVFNIPLFISQYSAIVFTKGAGLLYIHSAGVGWINTARLIFPPNIRSLLFLE